jgi:hypothetical protein
VIENDKKECGGTGETGSPLTRVRNVGMGVRKSGGIDSERLRARKFTSMNIGSSIN